MTTTKTTYRVTLPDGTTATRASKTPYRYAVVAKRTAIAHYFDDKETLTRLRSDRDWMLAELANPDSTYKVTVDEVDRTLARIAEVEARMERDEYTNGSYQVLRWSTKAELADKACQSYRVSGRYIAEVVEIDANL